MVTKPSGNIKKQLLIATSSFDSALAMRKKAGLLWIPKIFIVHISFIFIDSESSAIKKGCYCEGTLSQFMVLNGNFLDFYIQLSNCLPLLAKNSR